MLLFAGFDGQSDEPASFYRPTCIVVVVVVVVVVAAAIVAAAVVVVVVDCRYSSG